MGFLDNLRSGGKPQVTPHAGLNKVSAPASRRRAAKHKTRVNRDGDSAGMKFGRRSDWT